MVHDFLQVWYLFEDAFNEKFVKEILKNCFEIGCTTKQNGRTDIVKYHSGDLERAPKNIETDSAINRLASDQEGGIEFWYKDIRFDLKLNWDVHRIPSTPHFGLKISSSQFRSHTEGDNSDITKRVIQFLEVARSLAEISDPVYAYGAVEDFDSVDVELPEKTIESSYPRRLFWFNIFSKPMIDKIGKDRLFSAPAWKIETLSTGSVLLVVNDRPRGYKDEANEIGQHLDILEDK